MFSFLGSLAVLLVVLWSVAFAVMALCSYFLCK